MLHEDVLLSLGNPQCANDHRAAPRVPCPSEVTLIWHHNPTVVVRYRIVDVSDGGLRVRSSVPMLEGTTGMLMRMLPEGTPIDKPVMIVWSKPSQTGGYELGLRYL